MVVFDYPNSIRGNTTGAASIGGGLFTWVVPAGVTKIMIEIWGGGGLISGSGGGGGYGRHIFTVDSLATYTITVGRGGAGSGTKRWWFQ